MSSHSPSAPSLHPRLPLECLQLIIQYVTGTNNLSTLTTLLRVNRYVCEATLPFLYSDPFKHSYHRRVNNHYLSISRRRLAQTLLRQAPAERISDLVKATIMDWPAEGDETNKDVQPTNHDDKSKKAYPPPVVNYLSHIRHLNFDCLTVYDVVFTGYYEPPNIPTHIRKYMNEHNLADKLCRKNIDCLSNPSSASMHVAKDLEALIKTDLQWALCNPEQVQSLCIPLPHIKRYLDCVQDFKSLSSITFVTYNTMEAPPSILNNMSTEDRAQAEQIHQESISNAQDMVRFIEKHTSLYKGVLQSVDCSLISDKSESSLLTMDLQSRLYRCLPPLLNPQHLDGQNWWQLIARYEDTNLEYVESIKLPWNWRNDLGPFADTFMGRCRSLTRLRWVFDHRDGFQWAVDEKRQHDADLAKGLVPKPLVPLKAIECSFKNTGPGREIDDAAIAFGDTLESLRVTELHPNGNGVGQPPELRCGQGWHLLHLSLLGLRLQYGTLHMAPEALVGCRSLVNLHLEDSLTEYDHHQIQSWLPSGHPSLMTIVLRGTPALSFHPDTLHTTPMLYNLSLTMGNMYQSNHHYIPPVEVLEAGPNNNNSVDEAQDQENQPSTHLARPRWTWDWHLPNLARLNLSAEFAYRFQFRMLQKCPRLEELTLHAQTLAGTHRRIVTLQDLSFRDGYMKLPHLFYFQIVGAWHMENEVLRVLFHEVATNIQNLYENYCTGFDLEGWMEATSGLHQLKTSHCSLEVTEQQLMDMGLESSVRQPSQVQEHTHIAQFSFLGDDLRYIRRPLVVISSV